MIEEARFVLEEVYNPKADSDPEFMQALIDGGGYDARGNRVKGRLLPGDVGKGRVYVDRYNGPGGKGPYRHDIGWPHMVHLPLDGYGIDEGYAALLTGLVLAMRPSVVFETGTHKGRSTKAIVQALESNGQGHITTVDKDDYEVIPGIFTDDEAERVTNVVGLTPEVFGSEELEHVQGIDFAHLDGAHDESILEELDWVESRAADVCYVIIDNASGESYQAFREALNTYTKYPRMTLDTLCGAELIWMARDNYWKGL